jgi:elongation factor P
MCVSCCEKYVLQSEENRKENPPLGATTTADFYNGMVIRYNGELYTVTEFHHVSPGNWRAFVRVRLKNLKTGKVLEQRFRAGEEIDAVRVEHQNWQFLYIDGDSYIFMNVETFDQQPVSRELLGDGAKFLKEGDIVEMLVEGENIIAVELPNFLELINVPLFVNPGDRIRIDTRSGQYVERVK